MASLKEIKGRIASVKSTQKITSAMKMVASAKLRKAQQQIDSFLPYQQKLNEMLTSFLSSVTDFESNLAEVREVKRVAIVVLSSNSSLCGAFNSNVVKLLKEALAKYKHLNRDDIEIYPIGKKVEDTVRKMNLPAQIKGSYIELMDKPHFEGAKQVANELIAGFSQKKIDKVELLYNHSKTTAIQIPTVEQYLPVRLEAQSAGHAIQTDYLIEPDKNAILSSLIPRSLHSKIYAVLLDSAAAEQGARVVAMQIATDNAGEILDGLTIQYNKQRQQAITSELLDIIGGSEALK
ncbi:MAG: F0F1 ATP synthase subunit gamma [Candidatus Symbiothrix sp.]|jgi:F-type H+-transporting ATPase subunit gamma|nr:F0F1 ATP synthase subunit gamma [Candidatus Symbiothrix sp.]